jgi:transposase InsO family protein
VLAARRRRPHESGRKLVGRLRQQDPTGPWPSRSTACAWLKRADLIRVARRRRRPAAPRRLRPITRPNDTWTADFKGQFRTTDGHICFPLTVRDAFSRYVVRCDALPGPLTTLTRHAFERAFAEFGLPTCIRTDNGAPFAGTGFARLSQLAVWWMRWGIQPERIAPAHPEQNGSHEQFHSVLKRETARPPAATLRAQQRRFRTFCRDYNEARPHEALQDQPPATRYQPSARQWSSRLPTVEYPGYFEVRRVSPAGQVALRGHIFFLSETLAGEDVGFEEVADGVWTIYYTSVALGRFDERTQRVTSVR